MFQVTDILAVFPLSHSLVVASALILASDSMGRLIVECCDRHKLKLLALETDIDHIPVFVSAPPRYSPANLANLLKGYTSKFLRQKFPKLKKICGRDALWTSAYYVGTAGNVSAEVIRRYISECQGK
ncbi:IS200/IS605 family transposase [Pleurocapsales cyanobacterium LEGE 06147]|nr:IS200/IS605 family transposase [Pleurocapsales cyanobacterium LEGE 06147]